jgi:hypothetical protein
MKDLLKEAIADAKTVRETALANAKLALEEAFTPRLQSIISSQLQEEDDLEDDVVEDDEVDTTVSEPVDPEVEDSGEETQDTEEEFESSEEDEEDVDLDEIIRELEGMDDDEEIDEELDSSDIGQSPNRLPSKEAMDSAEFDDIDLFEMEDDEDEMLEGDEMADDEEIDLDEVIKSLREEEEAPVEDDSKEEELEEAYNVIRFLKDKINEVNLLNAKLLYSNKLFKSYDLNENQKMKVIENFDRAVSLREVKLVFSTLAESFRMPAKKMVKESFASKPVASTKPKAETVLTEGNELAARFKKLAGLI